MGIQAHRVMGRPAGVLVENKSPVMEQSFAMGMLVQITITLRCQPLPTRHHSPFPTPG